MAGIDLLKHSLISPHRVLSDEEKLQLLQKLNVSEFQLPLIKRRDPVIALLKTKAGDVVEIHRESKTGFYNYYRRII